MSIYAIIYLVLSAIGLLIAANQHGKPKKEPHNFWSTLIATSIVIWLLYSGGFFDIVPK